MYAYEKPPECYFKNKLEELDTPGLYYYFNMSSKQSCFSANRFIKTRYQQQIILQSLQPDQSQQKENWKFRGNFGVINLIKNELNYLYLGDGNLISYKAYTVEASDPHSTANLTIDQNKLLVYCNHPITISIAGSTAKKSFC